jgi:hypothetical protein
VAVFAAVCAFACFAGLALVAAGAGHVALAVAATLAATVASTVAVAIAIAERQPLDEDSGERVTVRPDRTGTGPVQGVRREAQTKAREHDLQAGTDQGPQPPDRR